MPALTPDQLRQYAAAMLALADGKPVQSRPPGDPQWADISPEVLTWNFKFNEYRPKPEPRVRPWSKPEDVPGPVCWIRGRHDLPYPHPDYREQLIIGFSNPTAFITASCGCEPVVMSTQFSGCRWEHMEYSTDRKMWHPCTVTEEA